MSTATREPTTRTTAEAGQPVVIAEPQRTGTIGLVALGLAIVGFIFAALLLTAGFAWLLLLPAIALGVIGLFARNRRRGAALAAVIVGVLGLILAFVGFRLPAGFGEPAGGEGGILNNSGVNPFSVLTGGGTGAAGQPGADGQPGEVGGVTTENPDGGLAVDVTSVDCHTPLATVTGLNITGEVCRLNVAVTNNGEDVVTVDSSDVTANVGGNGYLADVNLGEDDDLLDVQLGSGQTGNGSVYVNLPDGSAEIDSVTVSTGETTAGVTVGIGG